MVVLLFVITLLSALSTTTIHAARILRIKKPLKYEIEYQEKIDRILTGSKDWKYFDPETYSDEAGQNSTGIIGGCHWITEVEIYYMLEDLSRNKSWPIVQSKYLQQKIKTTRCVKTKESCYEEFGLNKLGLSSVCKESYRLNKIYFYDPDRNMIYTKKMTIPYCCTCTILKENPDREYQCLKT